MSIDSALQELRLNPGLMRNVVRWERIPAHDARTASTPGTLDARLKAALKARGIGSLYTHQAAAVAAATRGEHVAVVTEAASGKTLCYNLPVLDRLLADTAARALYLFPTKALAQDQLVELRGLIEALPSDALAAGSQPDAPGQNDVGPQRTDPILAATYDGDTPSAQRARIRAAARIVFSNPDMLHAGILPHHPRWAGFFAGLQAVVVDEMHAYRGVFGSHVANVLRRLRRICRFYGSRPQFFLASATIANPDEVAQQLVEAPVTVIGPEMDGAPRGEKHMLFYDPPIVDPALGIRRSSHQEAVDLAAHLLAHGVQTILFARARLTVELILTSLRERAASFGPDAVEAIRGYRSGYLAGERRAIEKGLREGAVRAVVATNALELGIDIGRLDAAVLAGYPGSVASLRQQMGRAGRRQGNSIGILVAGPGPLDQYLATHPEWLLAQSPEHARLNPDNEIILAAHLACAAAELPLARDQAYGPGAPADLPELLADLVDAGQLYAAEGRCFWAGDGSPAPSVSLRSAAADRIVIQAPGDAGRPQVIGELDRASAPLLLHEGAVYLHEGAAYLVERLEWDGGVAHVRPIEADFYTRPSIGERIEVLAVRAPQAAPPPVADGQPQIAADPAATRNARLRGVDIRWGEVRIVSQASGYRILRRGSHELLGFGEIDLPEQQFETEACWLVLQSELVEALKAAGAWLSGPNDYGPNWPEQRNAARARDGHRCQGCGARETAGHAHDVHHRIPLRAFIADPALREGLDASLAWRVANRIENLVTLCPTCHRRAETSVRTRSGLGGAAALLAGIAPLFLMCDPRDLGVIAEPEDPATGLPTITLYEKTPGGVGYAEQLFASMADLVRAAHDAVVACGCELGCPACVGPVLEHEYALDAKALAAALLKEMCGA